MEMSEGMALKDWLWFTDVDDLRNTYKDTRLRELNSGILENCSVFWLSLMLGWIISSLLDTRCLVLGFGFLISRPVILEHFAFTTFLKVKIIEPRASSVLSCSDPLTDIMRLVPRAPINTLMSLVE